MHRTQWNDRICGVLLAGCVANIVAFGAHGLALGGSVWNGKRERGKFFVGDHGRFTEVTERQWQRLWRHELSLFATVPLGILAGFLLQRSEKICRQRSTAIRSEAAT